MNEKKLMEQVVELYQIHVLCKNCGTGLPAGTKFCTNCGTKQEAVPGEEKHKTLFITVIVLLSLAAVGSGITAFVFFDRFNTKWEQVESYRNTLVVLAASIEKGRYDMAAMLLMMINNADAPSIVPWKHPLDRAAVITKIYYIDKNSYWNYTDPLQADKIAYLQFDFRLTGNIPIGESLSIKIIRASTGEDKCENRHTVTVTKKKEYSTGWGNASGGTYERGWYLIQIVRHNEEGKDLISKQEVIGQQYVYIQ